jgi:hypothetical protein
VGQAARLAAQSTVGLCLCTADRETNLIGIAVSAAANAATTAGLSHASTGTLLVPQMSWSPCRCDRRTRSASAPARVRQRQALGDRGQAPGIALIG